MRRLLKAEDGSSAVEYALLLAVIAGAIVAAGMTLRDSLDGSLNGSAANIEAAATDAASTDSTPPTAGNNACGHGNGNAGGNRNGNGHAGGNGNCHAGGNGNH